MKPVPRVRTLHRALRMTQEEFAERFHLSLATLRGAGRVTPRRLREMPVDWVASGRLDRNRTRMRKRFAQSRAPAASARR